MLGAKELMLSNCGTGENLESLLYGKEIQPVNPKGNQPWIFIGRTDAETPTLWPPGVKNWLIWKDPDTGTEWRWEEKGAREDEMVGWHHWLNGHEFEQTPGDGEGQGRLACWSLWVTKSQTLSKWTAEHLHRSPAQSSRSAVSDSSRPHEPQHARPPCPSPTPGVHSDSYPSGQWCHPAISSSVLPFSSCPQSFPASESFSMSQLFAWGDQSTGVYLTLKMNWDMLQWQEENRLSL